MSPSVVHALSVGQITWPQGLHQHQRHPSYCLSCIFIPCRLIKIEPFVEALISYIGISNRSIDRSAFAHLLLFDLFIFNSLSEPHGHTH